ncbi:MAG TPA: TROVE domain-containing protein, partial [Gemmatimonadales bacterium]|nr:TROVE domain-containing protein [Gemmatimonadales bacterium]
MTSRYASHINAPTPQSQPLRGREAEQVKNYAGGYVFKLDPWQELERFVILGTMGGTYYVSEQKLTQEAGTMLAELLKLNPVLVIDTIVKISDAGRAPKNTPALFALAMAASPKYNSNVEAREWAFEMLPKVARTGTHLLQFVNALNELRGWGPQARKGIGRYWFGSKRNTELALRAVKDQSREGWSLGDVLRLCHIPLSKESRGRAAMFTYLTHPERLNEAGDAINIAKQLPSKIGEVVDAPVDWEPVKPLIAAREKLHRDWAAKAVTEREAAEFIREQRLPREAVPTDLLNSKEVWNALLDEMPITAMIRNLGKMTNIELLKPGTAAATIVIDRLADTERLRKGRVHPMQVLIALRTYANGRGARGSLTWSPVAPIVAALDAAFYECFQNVRPTGKRFLIGLDVSGSMGVQFADYPGLTVCEAAAAMAMILVARENWVQVMGFAHDFRNLGFHSRMSLEEATKRSRDNNFGTTDCALPFVYAKQKGLEVDTV